MKYKVIKHTECINAPWDHPIPALGQKVWPVLFNNINNAFRCAAEYNEEMPYKDYFVGYTKTGCDCKAVVEEVNKK